MSLFDRLFPKNRTVVLHITSSNGFHLRPAALFAAEAKKFPCNIEAESRGKVVNAKNLNALLSLNLDKGDHFDLICKGKDAEAAIETLTQTFETLMKHDTEIAPIEAKERLYEGTSFAGEIISKGVAVAPLWHYTQTVHQEENGTDFTTAVTGSIAELETLYRTHKAKADSTIYLAQKALLASLLQRCDSLEALEAAVQEESEALHGGKLEAKISDYQDILYRVKRHMGYRTIVNYPNVPFILVADDLLPSQIESLPKETKGVILKNTSPTSHTAILLRASGIPSLIFRKTLPPTDGAVILDATAGVIVTAPTPADLEEAKKAMSENQDKLQQAHRQRLKPAVTASGQTVKVLANVTDPASAQTAKEAGAEGIGLLRTEFLFKEHAPSFEEQRDAYRAIFDLFDDVTIRTLDVGGDKALPYIDLPKEDNPFLGIRGIRLLQTHPELIEAQLHAIFAAADGRGIKVMFPMVSTVEEFKTAKNFAKDVAHKHSLEIANISFGIMVEVPSVLFLMPEFNKVVDFYSIGSNDLNQYLFAIERTHATLTLDPRSSVLFDAIGRVIQEADKPVSLCGELAGDTEAVPELIKRGITTLSLSAQQIPIIKETIRHV